VFLLVLALLAGGLALASRSLIVPYPHAVAWFESTAFFPLLALGLMALAGVVEVFHRRRAIELKIPLCRHAGGKLWDGPDLPYAAVPFQGGSAGPAGC
jgi:hypothetical protein